MVENKNLKEGFIPINYKGSAIGNGLALSGLFAESVLPGMTVPAEQYKYYGLHFEFYQLNFYLGFCMQGAFAKEHELVSEAQAG